MTSPRRWVPLALAISSIVSTPFLWFVQFFGMWTDGVIGAIVVLGAGALTFVLPVSSFVAGRGAQKRAPQIIGSIVGAVCLAWQVWVTLSITGVCGLFDGCY